jgi:peptidyl-prolyl cis-trans isomerase C
MSRKWRVLTMLACAALVAGACKNSGGSAGGDDEVLARVGKHEITRSYFEDRIVKMDRRFLPDTLDLAGKRKFLDFIINKEIMATKAEELKYGDDPRVTTVMKTLSDNLAANAAIDHLTEGKLDPTDQDIQAFFEKKHHKILAKHILVRTRKQADDVRKQLMAGADFDSMAAKYSEVPRTDANTGEPLPLVQRVMFGEVQYGEAMIPVEEAVFNTKLGEVSEPVETGYGWHLFKPISESEVSLPALDAEAKRQITVQIQLRRKRLITEAYYDEIAKAHGYKLDEDTAVMIYDKLPKDVNPEDRPDPKTEAKPIIPFSREERDRVLFELDGKKYTVGDFSDRYDQTSWFERPKRITGVIGVKAWIRDRWMKPLQLERARKDGVYDLPQVADEIKIRREQMMVNLLHENLVAGQAPAPTEDQIKEFYDAHKDVYVDKEARAVNLIYNREERVVRRAWDEIHGGKPFVDVAVRYNENAVKPEDVQTPGFTADQEQFKEIAPQTFALAKVGDYTEPFKTENFWVMLQLAAVTPQRQMQLDEIHDAVKEDWQNQWSEDKLNELLAEWKKEIKVEVNEDALARAKVDRTDVFVPGRAETSPAGASGSATEGAP